MIKYKGKPIFILLNSPLKYDYKGDASYIYNYDQHNKIYWLFKAKNLPPSNGRSLILNIDRIFP